MDTSYRLCWHEKKIENKGGLMKTWIHEETKLGQIRVLKAEKKSFCFVIHTKNMFSLQSVCLAIQDGKFCYWAIDLCREDFIFVLKLSASNMDFSFL